MKAMLAWAWELPDVLDAVREAYRDDAPSLTDFARVLEAWLDGQPLVEIARRVGLDIDTMLGVHARVLSYVLQVAIEQAVGLLRKLVESNDAELSQAVIDFPSHLRFGVPSVAARVLAAGGVRHRRAAVALGQSPELTSTVSDDRAAIFATARQLVGDRERWLPTLGHLVLQNTIDDLQEPRPQT
jgi:hypothetical protein